MKKNNKNLIVGVLAVVLTLGLAVSVEAVATVNLLTTSNFAILAGSAINNTGTTAITGDVGLSPSAGTFYNAGFSSATVIGTIYTTNDAGPAGYVMDPDLLTAAKNDLTTAYNAAASSTPVSLIGSELGGSTINAGAYYSANGEFGITGTVILDGQGDSNAVFIFKAASTLTTTASSTVSLINGASACNVFWQVGSSAATLGANSTFKGNLLSDQSITLTTGANVEGRLLARIAAVTLDSNIVTVPTCTVAVATPATNTNNTITIFKHVINDSGGTATYTDFPLFVNGNPVDSGESIRYQPGQYRVTETNLPGYQRTFSGDCNASGQISHGGISTQDDICVVTNNDIGAVVVPPVPPLIDVVKVPSPLAMPAGPGPVTYTYTLTNVGTVPVTNVKLLGDTCSPIVLVSGDTNNNNKLDLNETWIYICSTTLAATHTNTVVATGWANGISANDVASATVIVGVPIVPPLIHVTKTPDKFTLPVGGGMITYTKKVTNPGTVALRNVKVTDDKCSSVNYISGDTNRDSALNPSETWTYTCRANLTNTTVNTAVATGVANGLTARDFAIATVVVATAVPKLPVVPVVPKLPNTGLPPIGQNIPWTAVAVIGALALVSSSLMVLKKRKN